MNSPSTTNYFSYAWFSTSSAIDTSKLSIVTSFFVVAITIDSTRATHFVCIILKGNTHSKWGFVSCKKTNQNYFNFLTISENMFTNNNLSTRRVSPSLTHFIWKFMWKKFIHNWKLIVIVDSNRLHLKLDDVQVVVTNT